MLSLNPDSAMPAREDESADAAMVALERHVVARAREFEVSALYDLLRELGYRDEDIVWKSRQGTSRGHSLIHAVELERAPRRRAVITLNLGLLGSETPLPSYFQKLIEESPDRLAPFFEYFDHALLRSRVRTLWPERDKELGCDWTRMRQSMSKLVRMDAPAMAHWLFRRIYPELEVSIRRAPGKRTVPTPPVKLSRSAIGDGSALGGVTDIWCGGLSATLVAHEPLTPAGVPWQAEAARRVREQLLPQLIDSEMSLTVTLIIRDQPSHLQLAPSSFLGLQPLQSGSTATKVLIFDGPIQDVGADVRLLGQTIAPPAASAPVAPAPRELIDAANAPRHGSLPTSSANREADETAATESYLARLR
jgi:hypothetical protein